MRNAILCAAMLACSTASATIVKEGTAHRYGLGRMLDNVDLADSEANRTISVDLASDRRTGYDLIILHAYLTRSTATTLDLACTLQPDGLQKAVLTDCEIASGVCTAHTATWSHPVTASGAVMARFDVSGFIGDYACVVSGTGAGASDIVTVYGWLVTK